VRSIGLIADTLRRGNTERLNIAISKLSALDKLIARSAKEEISLLVSIIYSVAKAYKAANIYLPLLELGKATPNLGEKLLTFAREQFLRKRGILWISQRDGIKKLISHSSFALCTPTGSGKTLIANLAILKELLQPTDQDISPLAVYLVPSRALAGEVEAKLGSELGSNFIITGLYGGSDWGITDYWLNADKPTVLIATVEKADALMRYLGPLLLSRLKLLIIDEAHQVVCEDDDHTRIAFAEHTNRSLRLESFVSRLLVQKPEVIRIALTAAAGGAAARGGARQRRAAPAHARV
jgi:ATP-dependent helicase YprA (DUF1998 family)